MKQKIYILGVVTTLIIITGTIFKVNHFPGASILMVTGFVTLILAFLPVALINSFKAEQNRQNLSLYIVTYLTFFVVFTGMLFKIMHWPYAGVMLTIALPFPYVVFLPVFLSVTAKNKNFNIYNTVFVLLMLALNSVFSGLLALNVSNTRIDDSYTLSRTYNNLESVLKQLPVNDYQSPVDIKINEVLAIADNYQDLILLDQNMTRETWEKDPGNLLNPDSPNIPMAVLAESGELHPGDRLQTALKELFALMKQSKDYERTAEALPAILGLAEKVGMEPDWEIRHVAGTNLSWVLIYLDGLKTNLLMIKASTE